MRTAFRVSDPQPPSAGDAAVETFDPDPYLAVNAGTYIYLPDKPW